MFESTFYHKCVRIAGPIHYYGALSVSCATPISFQEGSVYMSQFRFASRAYSRLPTTLRLVLSAILGFSFAIPGHAQSAPDKSAAPAPDVIVFTNGDQLTGKLLREISGSVTFHSDIAGDVTVTWDKIKSIHTAQQFAVVEQGQHVTRKTANADIAHGSLQVENDQVTVGPPAGATTKEIPVKNTQYVIDQDTFNKEVRSNPGFFSGWNGAITAGAALVEATQNSRSFTGSAALVRAIPSVTWLDPRNRTLFDFSGAYGSITQPGTAGTKTNIIHFDAEHDWYVSPRFYFLVDTAFDHNYSQGMNLQELYGAGAGYTLIKNPKEELDLKFDIHFERQAYFVTPGIVPPPPLTPSKNLVGADFGDNYMLKLPHGLVLNQTAVITPAFNQTNAYSALATAGLTFPVYKRFGFTVGTLDDFLNDPAAGSKKNSFQFTAGVTYTLK
jgi:hypothetical protein